MRTRRLLWDYVIVGDGIGVLTAEPEVAGAIKTRSIMTKVKKPIASIAAITANGARVRAIGARSARARARARIDAMQTGGDSIPTALRTAASTLHRTGYCLRKRTIAALCVAEGTFQRTARPHQMKAHRAVGNLQDARDLAAI